MTTSVQKRQEIIKEYATKEGDTGSPEVQVALLTDRIRYLTEHFAKHKNDNHSRRGLILMVHKRRKLLKYVESESVERYQSLIKRLGLRK